MELQDEKSSLIRKIQELNQKLNLKEEIITHIVNEKTENFNNSSTNRDDGRKNYSNINCNVGAFTQRVVNTEVINHNNSLGNNCLNDKQIKRIQFNLENNKNNYNTVTAPGDYIDFETSSGKSNYMQTEHMQNLEKYKIQKNQKINNKSIGFMGSIKNFFTNDKK